MQIVQQTRQFIFTDKGLATKESSKRNLSGEPTAISVHISTLTNKKTYVLGPRENRCW